MVRIVIPGNDTINLKNLVLDFNGTIASDGVIDPGIKDKIEELSQKIKVYILSADTRGNLGEITKHMRVEVVKIPPGNGSEAKRQFLQRIDPSKTAVIGNGYIDHAILQKARLGIAVIGKEGASVKAVVCSDVVVNNISDALDLFICPLRLIATLRR
jgi:soluble P-type ATPase